MDNLTHSLLGLAAAKAVDRRPIASTSVVAALWASNLADADTVLWPLFGKLTYLVHHRAASHSFLAVPLVAAVSVGLAGQAAWRDRRVWLAGIAAAALHVVADAVNDAGVKAFWPLSDEWFYGDLLFIVEPLLLAVLAPVLLHSLAPARRWRGLGAGVIVALLATLAGWLAWWSLGLVGCTAFLLGAAQRPRLRVGVTFAALAGVCALFAVGRGQAIALASAVMGPGDVALVPAPADPTCWRITQARESANGEVVLRQGVVTLAPGLTDVTDCARRHRLAPSQLRNDAGKVRWSAELRADPSTLARATCGDAFLSFSRMPYWREEEHVLRAVDLRFDMPEDGSGYSVVRLPLNGGPCP